jgi:hypothetical protein
VAGTAKPPVKGGAAGGAAAAPPVAPLATPAPVSGGGGGGGGGVATISRTSGALQLDGFLELLCRLAHAACFRKERPSGEAVEVAAELDALLAQMLGVVTTTSTTEGELAAEMAGALPRVRMDAQVLWRHRQYAHEPRVQAVLERLGPRLREVYHPPAKGLLKERPPSWRFGEVLALLHQRGLLHELQVPQTSAIVGDARRARPLPHLAEP